MYLFPRYSNSKDFSRKFWQWTYKGAIFVAKTSQKSTKNYMFPCLILLPIRFRGLLLLKIQDFLYYQ
jgi:hypothetical protein